MVKKMMKITFEYEDKSTRSVEGDDAIKWDQAVQQAFMIGFVPLIIIWLHGIAWVQNSFILEILYSI
jgi:hypothetical protein